MTISNPFGLSPASSSLNYQHSAIPGAALGANTIGISNGGTGPSLMANSNLGINTTQYSSALQIRGDTDPVLIINQDGTIVAKSGTIHVDDWIQVVKLMKRFIVDVANDEETAKKYPYLKDAAHQWMMNELGK